MAQAHTATVSRYGVAFYMLFGLLTYASGATDRSDLLPSADMPPRINPAPGGIGNLHDFDIPAQPLAAALNRYAEISNQPTVFSSEMVFGRTSSAVQGRYASERALRLLLGGTGLIAERHDSSLGAIFLLKEDEAPRNGIAALFSQGGYPGLIQTRIWQALCADARTAPGRYRILFRFQVDTAGHIADAHLLSSTGNARRDTALLETLQRVQIEAPPPAAVVQQPLTMLLLPDGPDAGPRCDREAP